jgi:hypothetical protein
LGCVLHQAYEDNNLKEILAAPPSALAASPNGPNQKLSDVFGIQTVAEVESNKYFVLAGAHVALRNKI